MASVVALTCYPVKSCAGVPLLRGFLTDAGLEHDRSFMVADEEGVFRTQRTDPLLATIRPQLDVDGHVLRLAAPGLGEVSVDVDRSGPRRNVTLFGQPFRGIDQGPAVAEWLSEHLGRRCRLVRVPPEHDRVTDGETAGTSGFADSCAVLVTSTESLAHLDERIITRGADPVPMDRFRANVVVTGWDAPHVEDSAQRIAVGDAELGFAKLAIRCVVTTIDQTSGRRRGPEPLRTLADYRRADGGGVTFGAKFAVLRPGPLAVGDPLASGVSAGSHPSGSRQDTALAGLRDRSLS